MTIAQCPKCREQVTIPTAVSRQARVRCPLCSEEYLLEDALRALPPLLTVVHEPEPSSGEFVEQAPRVGPIFGESSGEALPIGGYERAEDLRIEPAAPVQAPEFNFEPGSAVSPARSTTVSTRPRARRKEGSAIRTMIQTVGGGAMGLLIAQLILWWMPGNWARENRDPFGMASKVSPYVPFIVPSTLRPGAPTAQASPSVTPPKTGSSTGTAAKKRGFPEFESNIPADSPLNLEATPEEPKLQPQDKKKTSDDNKDATAISEEFPLKGLNEATTTEKSATPPDTASPPTGLEPANSPTKETGTVEAPAPAPAKTESTTLVPEKTDVAKESPTDGTVTKAAEIKTRLSDVSRAEQAWDNAKNPTNDQKLALIMDLFDKLAELGSTIAHSDPAMAEPPAVMQPVVAQLNALAIRPDKLVPLGRLAGMRLQQDRDKGGLVVGIVLSQQTRGKMHEVQLRLLAKSDPVVTVVSPGEIGKQLAANTNVVVLGRWVSNPKDNLAGYAGNAESVLLHGAHVVVPPASPSP